MDNLKRIEALLKRDQILKLAERNIRDAIRLAKNQLKQANYDIHACADPDAIFNPDESTKAQILQIVLDRVTEIATLVTVNRH